MGTAARGAALDGGSAAAVLWVVWRRCGRAGLLCFFVCAHGVSVAKATDTKTTSK